VPFSGPTWPADTISYLFGVGLTFLLGVGLTDLGDSGRHLGGNKAIVGVFNGPAVYVNVRTVLIFLARVVVPVKNFTSIAILNFQFWPLNTAEILCPKANLSSSHKNQTTSIWSWFIVHSKGGRFICGLQTQKIEVPTAGQ
jgi:hypothetical protein